MPALFFVSAAVNIAIFYSTPCFILCVTIAVNKMIFYSAPCSILCASSSSQLKQFFFSASLYTLCQQQSTKVIFSSALCSILCASSSQHHDLLLSALLYTLGQQQSTLQFFTQHLAPYFVLLVAVNIAILYLASCSILCASSS